MSDSVEEVDTAAMFDLSTKKKKKKSKKKTAENEDAIDNSLDDMFKGKKKKKKKSKKKSKKETEDDEGNADDNAEGAEEEENGGKELSEEGGNSETSDETDGEAGESKMGYKYDELLQRLYNTMHGDNPRASERKRYVMTPPEVLREGSKKTAFVNFPEICELMHRSPDHVMAFLYTELGTTGSVDGTGRLIIKGRYQSKQVESILRRYITEYVQCAMCKSPDTELVRNNVSRLTFVECKSCNSSRSVAQIKGGFSAQIGRRRKR